MSPYGKSPLNRGWWIAAAIGTLLFLLIQVFPSFGELFVTERHPVLTREQAAERARAVAAERFGLNATDIASVEVTYMTDSEAVA